MSYAKYQLSHALRPFSFAVALVTCLTGIVAAAQAGYGTGTLAVLVLLAALLLQAGVNLINDYADLEFLAVGGSGAVSAASKPQQAVSDVPDWQQAEALIRRNFRLGLGCIMLAAAIGIYLVALRGLPLLLLLLLGLFGALGYTLEPVNFKRRGLAVVLVFWLMGVLMVCGAYYVVTGQLHDAIVWQSLPVSLLSALLLLANELRDVEQDRAAGVRTLTVRIGFVPACELYRSLLVAVALLSLVLWLYGYLPAAGWLLLSVPWAMWLLHAVRAEPSALKRLPPLTGGFFMLFGLLYLLSL